MIHDGRPGDGIHWVNLAYLPRNVAPVIDGITVQDPGVRVQGANVVQAGQQPTANLKMPQTGASGMVITQSAPARFEQPPQGFVQKGYASVLWSAHDENDDELRFAVYYRGENETQWKLLKDKLDQKFYSWDSTALPDGAYYLKITASDANSNPPAAALGTERESERFVVDNTPPSIEGLSADASNRCQGQSCDVAVTVKFIARDATSSIERAQYSVDGADWILAAPAGNVSDSTEEHYQFSIDISMKAGESEKEHSIAVRAYDHFDNVGSAKTTLRVVAKR